MNRAALTEKLLRHLSVSGPSLAKDVCETLSISQPAFSRLVQKNDAVLRIGRGRQTHYAVHRYGTWGQSEIPVVLIDAKARHTLAATLHPLAPRGYYLESHTKIFTSRLYQGWPFFFEDMRPAGFLGRLEPRLHPELELPQDITLWTDDHCLTYLVRWGWDAVGQCILGERAADLNLQNRAQRLDVLADADRKKKYPQLADLVMSTGIPGSSAAGEHPKFLAIRRAKGRLLPVLVKFSPPLVDAISRRVADLLVCEHIAHGVLKKFGHAAAQSVLIKSANRIFLEMERFDRTPCGGRRGVVSLRALDLEFVGQLTSWSGTAEALLRQKKIDHATYESIVWLDVFARLIGNSDCHHGNLSFFCTGEKICGLTPVYDMLPMLYAPQQNQLVARTFDPAPPKLFELPVWSDAVAAAREFWARVQSHAQISREFKKMTIKNEEKLVALNPER